MVTCGRPYQDWMRRTARTILELKKRGDGVRILTGALQRVRGHNPEGPIMVDGGNLGKGLQLCKGG